MTMFDDLATEIRGKNIRLVFPEGEDIRILGAAVRLAAGDLAKPILLGDPEVIQQEASDKGWRTDSLTLVDPNNYPDFDEMVDAFVEVRGGKNTKEEAQEMLKDPNYLGMMMVQTGKADGLVSGAVYTTANVVRPALQIIKTRPGASLVSSSFIMVDPQRGGQQLVFSDCAINIKPSAEQLADIAIQSAETAKLFHIDPKVAMLSFSTHGSGFSEDVDRVLEATKIAQEKAPDLPIDGELQFDAAYSTVVAQQKSPDSEVAGAATVFVFPDIQSGNIGYKIAQRLGHYEAIGPILQGLNKPVSDLSRGSVEEDVFKLSIVTATQTLH